MGKIAKRRKNFAWGPELILLLGILITAASTIAFALVVRFILQVCGKTR